MSRTVKYLYNLFRVRCHCWLKRQRLGVPLHLSACAVNTPYSMVWNIIRADILRVALYFSEPRRGEEKYEQ